MQRTIETVTVSILQPTNTTMTKLVQIELD